MSQEPVRVWLAMDPEGAALPILLNRVPLDAEYAHLRDDLTKYCAALFANMPGTLRAALRSARVRHQHRRSRRRRCACAGAARRKVHLGCGPDVRPGWLNIDYRPGTPVGYSAANSFLNYDLRQGFPAIPDKSVEIFFSSHFFEHLRHEESTNLMREGRRALVDGGVARFQMPDFKGTFRAYVDDDRAFLDTALITHHTLDHMPDYARNWGDLVSRSVYEFYTHKYVWDPENLSKALLAAGLSDVKEVEHDDALDNPEPNRKAYSYYLVATA